MFLTNPYPLVFTQGNCIKLGQNHVRLPESGRGAPCGRPPQGITPGTVQIVLRYRKFHTSLATGGRFLGRKKEVGAPLVGALPPLWAPFSGHNAWNCADRIALSQIPYVFGDWRPVSWPKNEGRGTPCGCPPPPCGRPSQGIAPRTVQIVVRYRKFSTSLATGGRFLGRKKKVGAPLVGALPALVGALRRLF